MGSAIDALGKKTSVRKAHCAKTLIIELSS
jgi:hypothetical protein